jgi:iron complex outermembrane receptor protein
MRQEGQQWGAEHGIEIDDYNVSRVEVIKGPASLSYGSDALAGVINILSEEPAPRGRIKGKLSAAYQANNGLGTLHGRLAGNQDGLYWSGFYTAKRAHDYRNAADGYVYGTRFRNDDYGATIGINKHWGSSRLSFTSFNQQLGIAEGARDSATGRLLMPINDQGVEGFAVAGEGEGRSYDAALPRQQIRHQKLSWVNTVYGSNGGRAGFTLGYQENVRKEFDDVLQPETPGLHLRLQTLNYGLQYLFPNRGNGWQLSAGLNGMYQDNVNKGTEFIVPDYRLFDIGGYVLLRKEWHAWTFSGGLRGDYRALNSAALYLDSNGLRIPAESATSGDEALFTAFTAAFSSPSGSLGLSYELNPRTTLKLNFASGYRAPNIAELSANGVHEGAIRYEYGNRDLKPENSFQADFGGDYVSEHLSLNAAVFYNYIRNFIYVRKLNGAGGQDSIPTVNNDEGFPAFLYAQTGASLFGGELFMDFHPHPLDWLHMEHTVSYVQGRISGGQDSTRYLPMIPGARWLAGLRAQFGKRGRHLGNAFLKLELDHYFAQSDVYSAYGTETPSAAYTLLHASLGFDLLRRQRPIMSLTISGQNLGDASYQNHLSRLRFADRNPVTGRTGIFGMGRNISVQIAVPLDFASGK